MKADPLARASCAIFVNGNRKGTGTLVTGSHVLTAAHVVRREGPVTVQFVDGTPGGEILAERMDLGAAAEQLDIAVLELGAGAGHRPPATLWAAERLPQETKAFGYPLEEKYLTGVWRESRVSGGVQGGLAQLDWDQAGTLTGHSGGPVCDKASDLMAGVLVQGSESGHFDRMVTLAAVRTVWDGLPRPWLFWGEDARAHFTQRAAGQRSTARGGDLFRGRQEALVVVRGWLCADVGPEIPLVVTAQPGAGKSAVLARTVLAVEHAGQPYGVAFHARGATVADLVDAISAASGLDTPSSWQELVATLMAQDSRDVLAVAVDALDEAKSDQDLAELRQALRELARLAWLRFAVATRPLATRNPYGPGTHLYGLGVSRENSRNLINLDADRFFSTQDLIAYADALLAQDGFTNPGPPGGAWEAYRQNTDARARLAQVVAHRADRNYLVTGLAAFQLGEDDMPLDPAAPMFDPNTVPSGIGDALDKHLNRLPPERRWREEGLLTALAYGRGAGLDDQMWLAFTQAIGFDDVKSEDLARLRASGAADYLLETNAEADGRATRLFHQALADELLARRNQRRADEALLLQVLQATGGDRGWLASSPYARNHAPSHAAEAGRLADLVCEPDFLVSMSPAAMRSAAHDLPSGNRHDPMSIYDTALPFLSDNPAVNAAVLELLSQTQGNRGMSRKLEELPIKRPYKVVGNIRPFNPELARFEGHTEELRRVAALEWPGLDHPVIVTTSSDRTARVWDPRDPGQELAQFDGHSADVWGVAVLEWPGLDHPVIVTTSSDRTARVWDPRDPGQELARFEGHTGEVWGVAVLEWPGLDHPVIVTASLDGTARVWDPRDPGQELARFEGHTGEVREVAVLEWPGLDHPVIVTASLDGTARVWDPRDPGQELARFEGHADVVLGVAVLGWPGLDHPVIVTASGDRTAMVWDPRDPRQQLARFEGHTSRVVRVAALEWPGLDHPVIVTTSQDGTARVWDPRDPGQELARFDGHSADVWGVAVLEWPDLDHPVIVTASGDRTARVWDPRDPGQELAGFEGHTGEVWGVAVLEWPGLDHPVIVTTSRDGTARVWDPRDPGQELARFEGHTDVVWGVAVLEWPGLDHPVIVTASGDRTAMVWDPRDPGQELARFEGHAGGVFRVAVLEWPGLDHPVIVTTSWDGTARVWDPRDPGQELARFEGHTDVVWGVAVLEWPGLDHPVIVTASGDRTAMVWDPRDPGQELARFEGHTGGVFGVAVLEWPGLDHPVIVTTSQDGTARVWDPRDPGQELARFEGHADVVLGVAVLEWPGLDHPLIVTASSDGTARVWDPRDPGQELARLSLFGQGFSVVAINQTTLAFATSRGYLVFELWPAENLQRQ